MLGSPPRMRGKAAIVVLENLMKGDHPRVCGEKCELVGDDVEHLGSPPRMRGKAPVVRDIVRDLGITPAYAGKRVQVPPPDNAPRDHPRVCGEKRLLFLVLTSLMGSPPRMRGKGNVPGPQLGATRITPAYAGKSQIESFGKTGKKDHPRVCGEKSGSSPGSSGSPGSPPRMRGKGSCPSRCARASGITPAYAGKSTLPSATK